MGHASSDPRSYVVWAALRRTCSTAQTQMISPAVCALMTLAFLLDAAWLAAAAKAAGSG